MQEVAKYKHDANKLRKVSSELFFLHLFSAVIVSIIYLIIIFSFDFFLADLTFYLYGGLVILLSFSTIDWFYSGMEQFSFIATRSLIVKILGLIALFSFVKDKSDLLVYLLIFLFSTIANQIWNLLNFGKQITLKFKGLNFRQHLPLLIVLFSTGISTTIYAEMDTMLLGFLTTDTFVGFYAAAIKLNKVAIPIIVSFGIVLIPKITQSFYQNDKKTLESLTRQSFQLICLIGVPTTIGLCVYAPEFMLMFSGKLFNPAVITMQITSPLPFIIAIGHISSVQLLIPAKKEKYYLWATIVGLVVNMLLNLSLIYKYQDRGAAISALVGELAVSLVAVYFVRKKLNIRFDWIAACKALLSSIIFIPIAKVLRIYTNGESYFLFFALFTCVLVYFLIQLILFKNSIVISILKKIGNYKLWSK